MGNKTDLIIVGAGIVGLATAWRAHHQGRRVHVIDRANRPVGASIQNFGHACFTAQADAIQDVAADSRDGWKTAAAETGLWAAQPGTVAPAVSETEMTVLRQFHDHRGSEQVTLLSANDTRERLGLTGSENSGTGDIIGGALLPLDMRVNPREAAPRLAEWLAANGVEFSWNTAVHHVEDGQVDTSRGTLSADEVVVYPGHHVGDSHDYEQSPEPFIQQSIADLLMDNASAYLGIEHPVVRQRWQGRYADSPNTNLVLERPDDRTAVAVVASGIGMTVSFGIATLITEHRDAPDFLTVFTVSSSATNRRVAAVYCG